MRLYLINVKWAEERLRRMTVLLDGMGLPFERIEAADARAIGSGIAEAFDFHDGTTATDPEMVCVLSHIRAWEAFAASGAPAAVFLEDDVHFAASFPRVLAELEIDPAAEAIWRLETYLATVTVDRRPTQRLSAGAVYALHSNHAGTAAYGLSRAMAQRLLAQRRAFRRSIDTELFDPDRRSIVGIEAFQCIPAPCIQDDILHPAASAPYLASLVGENRHDVIAGVRRADGRLVQALKSAGRPAYRWLASQALRPRGLRRVYVPFG